MITHLSTTPISCSNHAPTISRISAIDSHGPFRRNEISCPASAGSPPCFNQPRARAGGHEGQRFPVGCRFRQQRIRKDNSAKLDGVACEVRFQMAPVTVQRFCPEEFTLYRRLKSVQCIWMCFECLT